MRRILLATTFFVAIVAVLSWTAVAFSTVRGAQADAFEVRTGDSVRKVAERLVEQGVIRNARFFLLMTKESGLEKLLQPGIYDLRSARTLGELAETLSSGGEMSREFVLRITEGENLSDIKEALIEADFGGGDLFAVTGTPAVDRSSSVVLPPHDLSADFPYLADKPSYVSLEGFLFPDTYRIFRDATAEEVVVKLLAHFDDKLDADLRRDIAASGRSVYEVVTLASIVEREVRSPEDKAMVADLFWRRLDKGMALQADSTVNYATGKSLPSVTFDDLETDSAYNTYKYPGLPPGPISNPGIASLRATASPQANPYWYFLTDPVGKVYYAKTYDEHLQNKARYMR